VAAASQNHSLPIEVVFLVVRILRRVGMQLHINVRKDHAYVGRGRGRTAPGDTLKGGDTRTKKNMGEFTKNSE